MPKKILKFLIAVVLVFPISVAFGDESNNTESAAPETADEPKQVVVIDPEIAATEEEEPDCE